MNAIKLVFLVVLISVSQSTIAQLYLEDRSQHRFAQTYVGLNSLIIPSQGSYNWNQTENSFPLTSIPRFTIGGLHFWGKLDFNMNIALGFIGDDDIDGSTKLKYAPGGDLSARFYPWRMEFGKVRPYGGLSLSQMVFGIETDNSGERKDVFLTTSTVTGLSYAFDGNQINLEMLWTPLNDREFYSDRSTQYDLKLPQLFFSLGFVKYFDTTIKNEKEKLNGRTTELEKKLSKNGKLNSLSIGVAPSWAYFLTSPEYSGVERQSVPRHDADFVWEFGVGYLLHNQGMHFGIKYRDYTSGRESFGLDHLMRRTSIAFEGFKFLWDYNGFVPFIGPSISYERWAVGEFEFNEQVGSTIRTSFVSPGVIFGWDIVASPLETWILRTNLRYYPFQKVRDIEGKKSRVDQFEFNFIEVVLYPGRMVRITKAKSKN